MSVRKAGNEWRQKNRVERRRKINIKKESSERCAVISWFFFCSLLSYQILYLQAKWSDFIYLSTIFFCSQHLRFSDKYVTMSLNCCLVHCLFSHLPKTKQEKKKMDENQTKPLNNRFQNNFRIRNKFFRLYQHSKFKSFCAKTREKKHLA